MMTRKENQNRANLGHGYSSPGLPSKHPQQGECSTEHVRNQSAHHAFKNNMKREVVLVGDVRVGMVEVTSETMDQGVGRGRGRSRTSGEREEVIIPSTEDWDEGKQADGTTDKKNAKTKRG